MKRSSYRGQHKGSTLKARSKIWSTRALNSLLAIVLVVGLAPSMSFAGEETITVRTSDGDLTEQVIEQQVPEETTELQTAQNPAEPVMKTQDDGDGDGGGGEPAEPAPRGTAIIGTPVASNGTDAVYTDDSMLYCKSEVKVSITVSNASAYDSVAVDSDYSGITAPTIALTGGSGTAYFTFTNAGTHSGFFTVKGNKSEGGSDILATFNKTVVIDSTAPEVSSVAFDKEAAAYEANKLYFNLSGDNASLKLTVNVTEADSGLNADASYVQVSGLNLDNEGKVAFSADNKAELTIAKDKFTKTSNTETAAGTATVHLKDKAGNEKTYTIVQKENMGIEAKADESPAAVSFTAENALLTNDAIAFTYEHDTNVKQSSGDYANWFNGKVTAKVTDNSNGGIKQDETTAKIDSDNMTRSENVWSLTKESAGTYNVTVEAKTAHGATRTYTSSFTIDNTTPMLSATLNTEAGTQGEGESTVKLYNAEMKPTLLLSVENYSAVNAPSSFSVSLQEAGATEPATLTGVTWTNNSGAYTATVNDEALNLTEGKTYTATLKVTDVYGQEYTQSTDAFMVDSQAPIVTVTFSDKKAELDTETEGVIKALFGSVGKATVTVRDPRLNSNSLELYLNGSTDKQSATWNTNENRESATLDIPYVSESGAFFGEGADRSLKIVAKDLAENETTYNYPSATTTVEGLTEGKTLASTFDVDKTAPVLVGNNFKFYDTSSDTSTTVKEPVAAATDDTPALYAAPVYVAAVIEDAHLDMDNSKLIVTGPDNTPTEMYGTNAWKAVEGQANQYEVRAKLDGDGVYTIQIVANDLVGNANSVDKTIKVNVDSKKPDIAVVINKERKGVDTTGKVDYFGEAPLTATVYVTDRNFDSSYSTITIDATGNYEGTGATTETGAWTAESDGVYKKTVVFNNSSSVGKSFRFTVTAQDKVGVDHKVEYAYGDNAQETTEGAGGAKSTKDVGGTDMTSEGSFVIDATPPDVAVVIDQAVAKENQGGTDYFGSVDAASKKLKAIITVTDKNFNSNAAGNMVTITNSGSTVDEGAWTQDATNKDTWTKTLQFPEGKTGEKFSFNFTATDWAGNTTAYKYGDNEDNSADSTKGSTSTKDSTASEAKALKGSNFAVDASKPNIEVKMGSTRVYRDESDSESKIGGFNSGKITIKVDDTSFDAAETGNIAFVPEVSNTGSWSADGERTVNLEDGTYSFNFTAKDLFANETAYNYGDAQAKADDKGEIKTLGSDGSDVSGDKKFIIDTTAPTLDVAFDTNPFKTTGEGVNLERYYNAKTSSVTATITAYDIHADASNFNVTVYDANGNAVSSGDVDITAFAADTGTADTYVAKVKITKPTTDATYTIKVTGKDKFENQIARKDANTHVETPDSGDAYYQSKITFDATAPKISVDWGSTAAFNGKYYKPTRTATVTIDEANFNGSLMQVSTDGKTWTATAADDWSGSGPYTYTKAFNEDGSYTFAVQGKDLAGNDIVADGAVDNATPTDKQAGSLENGVYTSKEFVIDGTAPTVAIASNGGTPKTVDGIDYYNGASPLAFTVTVKDDNFNGTNNDAGQTTVAVAGHAASNNPAWSGKEYRIEFAEHVSKDEASSISGTVYDLAGNHVDFTYKNDTTGASAEKFVLDRTAPQIMPAASSTNIPTNDPANNFHNASNGRYFFFSSQTSLKMNLYDALGIASYSLVGGADAYKINSTPANGNTAQAVEVALKDGIEFTDAFTLNVIDNAGNWRNWKINPAEGTISETASSSSLANTPLFNTTALRAMYPEKVIQDTVDPKVSLSGVLGGSYYNDHSHAVRLDIDELNFGYVRSITGGQVVLTTTAVNGGNGNPPAETKYARDMQAENEGAGKYYYVLPFTVDGHYTVSAQVTDPAGHSASAYIGEFTVDTKAPECTITWDNNDARNGMYYRAARTATITVTEHNFQASDFNVETTGAVSGWSGSGDTHTCTVSFATDGRYTLSVSGHDRAGNAMATVTEPEFVIDLMAPTIDFSNVTAQTAYNGEIAPVINYHDEANFDANGMTWTLTGNKHGAQTFAAGKSSSGNDGTVSFSDFPREVEADDIYTLQAHLTDMAGNEADNSITFSVNRFGSNFIIVDEEEFTAHNGYLAEPREVQVREINVSGALSEEHGVTVTHGLNTESLERKNSGMATSEGFYIESGNDSAGWSSYLYHIGSGNFADDGNYHVAINSTDAATNLNNSASYYDPDEHKLADAEVSFILDTADPIIDGISVSEGGTYDANTTKVNFTVIDNIGVDSVNVTLDGQEVDDEDVQMDAGGVVTVNAPAEAFTARNIEIVATDYAGRSAEAVVSGFHLTDSFIELNLPFVIGGVIVIAAAVVGGVFFVRRRSGR